MAKKFKDDKFKIIDNDIEKVRNRPSMYIAYLGELGVLHLCKEIIDNNRDECFKKDSPGNTVLIDIYEDRIVSRDNGRGIPTDLLRVVHETLNAGSNMTRSGGSTAGENGAGTTVYTALSSELIITSLRPQEKKKYTVKYVEGVVVEEEMDDNYTGKDHGMITSFKPSKKILGTDKIPVDKLMDWLNMFNYTLPENIHMEYNLCGKEHVIIKHRSLEDFFKDHIPNQEDWMSSVLTIECGGDLVEIENDKEVNRKFHVEAGLMYTSSHYKEENICKSWMNMIHTESDGMHVNGVINGYSDYIIEKVIKKKKNLEDEDLKKDVLSNLQIVVKCECDFAHMFTSQAKAKVFPRAILNGITKAIYEKLNEMPQNKINEMVEIVIANNRVRREGEKARDVSDATKKKSKWEKPKQYHPCSDAKTKEEKELYLVEGQSAGGGLRAARDARYQAILEFKGKSLNTWDRELPEILRSDPIKNLVNILGCGIGASFDINKLKFGKIIIATDADIDGYHIRVGQSSFFAKWMPDIINEGKLFIAEPPLYKLKKGKDVVYVTSTREYIKECLNTLGDIELKFGDKKVNAKEFVEDAFDYLNKLKDASTNLMVNRYLLEFIAWGFVKYGKRPCDLINNIDKWLRSLTNVYKEIGYDKTTNQIIATIDLVDQYVIIDDELVNTLEYMINIIEKYDLFVYISSYRKGLNESTTLGKFFEYIEDFYPTIEDRYKGLGSSSAVVSRETILDPRTRRLIKVTMSDIISMQRRMSVLVGRNRDDILNRKELLMGFKFTKDDIDN